MIFYSLVGESSIPATTADTGKEKKMIIFSKQLKPNFNNV